MRKYSVPIYIFYLLLFSLAANCYFAAANNLKHLLWVIPVFVFINLFAGTGNVKTARLRLKICCHGAVLLSVFSGSVLISVIYHIILAFRAIPGNYTDYIHSALICTAAHTILFWNGIICVYATSVQLGIKHRVMGIVFGMVPIANLIMLSKIIKISFREVAFEANKEAVNKKRSNKMLCRTEYPILMVHGVFFRDSKHLNYWGRIPAELEANGAKIYYGNHQSAASVTDSARELAYRIKEIVAQTGCKKVNIIAHSKGGLDCRCAIADFGVADLVASLTTINTPHRGCLFADYLLTKISAETKNRVASVYNAALRKLGDKNPDFLAAVNNLTAAYCTEFDKNTPLPEGIFCQSVGSVVEKASGGKFPLNFSYHLVKYFDGDNDGLVSEKSFKWGNKYILLKSKGQRGISHGDMIDLNRENIDGFDVREFYVELVSELKKSGL